MKCWVHSCLPCSLAGYAVENANIKRPVNNSNSSQHVVFDTAVPLNERTGLLNYCEIKAHGSGL